jgi:4-amino-4-deoxy-L-arabinose transferase-like glycosyltransferase
LVRALQAAAPRAALAWWLFTGFVAGLGLLSKYTMGIFAVSAAGYLLTTPALRDRLRTPGPWLGALLAGLLFVPNLGWNAAHGFATFGHTAEISNLGEARFSLARGLEFLAAQVGVFGPVTMLAFVLAIAGRGARRDRDPGGERATATPAALNPLVLLRWFALPFLLIITAQALAARAHANWAAPTYVAASLLAASWLAARPGVRWLAAAIVVDVLVTVVASGAAPLLHALDRPLRRDPTVQLQGWDALGRAVRRALEAAPPGTRLLVDDRRLMSLTMYYAGPRARGALMWNPAGRVTNHFHLLRDVAQAPDGPFLLISEQDRGPELDAAFESVVPLGLLVAPAPLNGDGRERRVFAWQLGALRVPAIGRRPRRRHRRGFA